MIEFLKQLPHLEHYGTPIYFIYLILAFLPIFVGLFFKKRFPVYEGLVSLIFIILMLTGSNLKQIYALLFYVVWQILIVYSYKIYRQKADNKWIFYLHSFLSVLPLIFVKVEPAIKNGHQSFVFNFPGCRNDHRNARWCLERIHTLGILTLYALYADLLKWAD